MYVIKEKNGGYVTEKVIRFPLMLGRVLFLQLNLWTRKKLNEFQINWLQCFPDSLKCCQKQTYKTIQIRNLTTQSNQHTTAKAISTYTDHGIRHGHSMNLEPSWNR